MVPFAIFLSVLEEIKTANIKVYFYSFCHDFIKFCNGSCLSGAYLYHGKIYTLIRKAEHQNYHINCHIYSVFIFFNPYISIRADSGLSGLATDPIKTIKLLTRRYKGLRGLEESIPLVN